MRYRRSLIRIVSIISTVFILILLLGISKSRIGISASEMEEIARRNVPSDENWESAMYYGDDAVVVLLYDQERVKYSFYVFEKRTEWFSSGYFLGFSVVGARIYTPNRIIEYDYDGEHSVYVSMNDPKIKTIKAWDKNDMINIEVDSQKPFVVLLPEKCDSMKYYDEDENKIPGIVEIVK